MTTDTCSKCIYHIQTVLPQVVAVNGQATGHIVLVIIIIVNAIVYL